MKRFFSLTMVAASIMIGASANAADLVYATELYQSAACGNTQLVAKLYPSKEIRCVSLEFAGPSAQPFIAIGLQRALKDIRELTVGSHPGIELKLTQGTNKVERVEIVELE